MGLLKLFLVSTLLAIGVFYLLSNRPSGPVEVVDGWYGSGSKRKDNEAIVPFKIDVPVQVLEDLNNRLKNSRISHKHLEDSNDFQYGFNHKYLLELKDYWLNKYSWQKQQDILNKFHHFKTEIEGLNIHFIREKASEEVIKKQGYTVVPLLIVHGWPGNVYEFYKMIPLLVDPKAHGISSNVAFEVIAPSIPGYGWSDQPAKTGFSQVECARVFRKLMKRLKFTKFFLQGGDWGSLVTSNLARIYGQDVLGLHLNMVAALPGASIKATAIDLLATFFPSLFLSSEPLREKHNFFSKTFKMIKESGYMHIQATKPDTVGTALNDSPIGLAAYILEKFSTWTNYEYLDLPDGGLEKKFTKDELLTIIMIYWVNGNIVSSQRFYKEFFLDKRHDQLGKQFVQVPTGHSSGMNELFDSTPVEVSREFFNITFYNEIPNMGHFAALEEPKPLAKDVLAFVQQTLKQ